MILNDLFAAALQLRKPWIVSKVEFIGPQNNKNDRGKQKHVIVKIARHAG